MTVKTIAASWEDLAEQIQVSVELGSRPFEVGSHRGADACDTVSLRGGARPMIELDPGGVIPSYRVLDKTVEIRGIPQIVKIGLVLEKAWRFRGSSGKEEPHYIASYTPQILQPDPPPVMTGPGRGYRQAPLGGDLDVVG